VRFWDTSALVPLLVREPNSGSVERELREDTLVAVAWTTEIECSSALARLRREGALDSPTERKAFARLTALAASWVVVDPGPAASRTAVRLVRAHPLRAADAIQLASAVAAAEDDPRSLPFVTLDERLAEAAEREGFRVTLPES
jgi:uncharacterized protein